MTMEKRPQRRTPTAPAIPGPGISPNPVAQGISVALFAAAQDNCTCRACQVLRKVQSEMTDQYLAGGK